MTNLIHSIARALAAQLRRQEQRWSRRSGPLLLVASAVTAVVLGLLAASPRTLRPTYEYAAGDFAAATIRAPWDLSIRDDEGTARMRDEAARYTSPVASFDSRPATEVPERIARVFAQAREAVADADSRRVVAPADLAKLGTASRRRLQQTRAREADAAVQAAIQDMLARVEDELGLALTPEESTLLAAGRFDRSL